MQFPDVAVMNVVMIYDRERNEVLLQNRTKKWCGGCFPGGHLETGETLYDSAVREVYEETGLEISDLEMCGLVHWSKENGREEYIFCYRTNTYSGRLLQCDEGVNFWVGLDKLKEQQLAEWFRQQLPLFFAPEFTEMSHIYDHVTGKFNVTFHSHGPIPGDDFLPDLSSLK